MKFSEYWLRTFVDPRLSTQQLADLLTFGGIEIESVAPVAPPFDRVVVGEVLSVEKHPNADRLNVCQVNVTRDPQAAPLTIVCGAPNVRHGMRVPTALVGANLPELSIKAAKVRGVESSGMLCSARELGLSDAADGLMVLPGDAAIGADVRDVLGLDDHIFESKPTPNRGDCLSVRGMARDVAALGELPLLPYEVPVIEASQAAQPAITLHAPQACPLYCGRILRGINMKAPTPHWMAQRLERSGIRAISAVVDVTNYVMLELGQPMHAFDAAAIAGGIQVRFARSDESLELLNGETRRLSESFLVIADDQKALALAGIMGGAQSAVGDATQNILLESAYFNPDVIAGKSRVLGFGSDSSFRFERGVNFAGTREAMERATGLVLAICGGTAGPVAVTEAKEHLPKRTSVDLRHARVERVLGFPLPAETLKQVFVRLGFAHEAIAGGLRVTPPEYRFDIAIEMDLIEEVARIHGYHNLPATAPVAASPALPVPEQRRAISALRRLLVSREYQEVVTYSFVDPVWERDFCANESPIALANPISSQMAVMRSSLFGGLISALAYNLHRKQSRVRIFELGRCFEAGREVEGYVQRWHIGAAACGAVSDDQWGMQPTRVVDFFDVKSDLEALFRPHLLTFEAAAHSAFHPGKSARIYCEGAAAGWMGELHPRWQQRYGFATAPVLFEVEMDAALSRQMPVYKTVSKFLPASRDIAAIFEENTPYQAVLDAINAQKPSAISDFALFDIYRGPGVENGKKSLAFRMLVQDTHKTMTDAEVDSAVSEIKKILQNRFNAKLR